MPSPFDGRKRDDIPRRLLALAGGGDPDQATAELVAVLGDGRFKFTGAGDAGFMAQSADGKLLAVPRGTAVILFDAQSGAHLRTLGGHAGRVYTVAFHPNSKYLAVGQNGGA